MNETTLSPVHCDFVGIDGNAYAVLAHWIRAARKAGWPKSEIDRVRDEAMSGDYDNLLVVLMRNSTDLLDEEDGCE